jgi:hypothetical protein
MAYVQANSQNLHKPLTSVYTGLGAYSLDYLDAFSFTSNQASLAQLKHTGIAVYGERGFMLSEFNRYTAAFGMVSRTGNFGLKAAYSGFSDFNETQLGLAYGRKLGSKLDIGAQFNYNGISITGYGNASAISFEAGAILHVSEKLHTGIHVNNPVGGKFVIAGDEKIASVYTVGFGFEASEKFFASTEIVKEEDQPVNVNAGFQYRFIPQLMVRIGISTANSTGWLGIGFYWRSFRADITSSFHQQLGLTPGLLLIYNLKSGAE